MQYLMFVVFVVVLILALKFVRHKEKNVKVVGLEELKQEEMEELETLKGRAEMCKIYCPFCGKKIEINIYAWNQECPFCKELVIKHNKIYDVPDYIEKDGHEIICFNHCWDDLSFRYISPVSALEDSFKRWGIKINDSVACKEKT